MARFGDRADVVKCSAYIENAVGLNHRAYRSIRNPEILPCLLRWFQQFRGNGKAGRLAQQNAAEQPSSKETNDGGGIAHRAFLPRVHPSWIRSTAVWAAADIRRAGPDSPAIRPTRRLNAMR